MADKALVTLLIGESYSSLWERCFAATWRAYAERHGYDVVVLDDYLDTSPLASRRSPHWQKCLILDHERVKSYRRVVWVDADILINATRAPCIVEATPTGTVGAVSHAARYRRTPSVIDSAEKRFYAMLKQTQGGDPGHDGDPVLRYRQAGLPAGLLDMVNTGVLVREPARHAGLLRHVYETGRENAGSVYENMPLSHALLTSGEVSFLDDAFNVVYPEELIHHHPHVMHSGATVRDTVLAANAIWINAYFLHFTAGGFRDDVNLIIKDFGDMRAIEAALTWLARNGH